MFLALAGLAGGGATLTRTQGMSLLPFLAMLLIFNLKPVKLKLRISMAVFLILTWALPIIPWMIRNNNIMGTWSLATNGGVNFYVGAHQGATGGYHIGNTKIISESFDEVTRDKEYFKEGFAYVFQNPVSYLSMIPNKMLRLWLPESVLTLRHDLRSKLGGFSSILLMGGTQLLHLTFLGLIALGLWKHSKSYVSPMALVIWSVVISQSLVCMVFFGGARYNAPMAPFLLVLALLPWVDSFSPTVQKL